MNSIVLFQRGWCTTWSKTYSSMFTTTWL